MSDGVHLLLSAPPPDARWSRARGRIRACAVLIALQLPIALGAVVLHSDRDRNDAAPVVADAEAGEAVGFFAQAADRTEAVDHYRFVGLLTLGGAGIGLDRSPVLTGARSGDRTHLLLDLGDLLELSGIPNDGHAVMEVYGDGAGLLIRTPVFGAPGFADHAPEAIAPLAALGDRWGRVDLGAGAAVTPDDVVSLAGQGTGPVAGLDLLAQAGTEPEEVGPDEVHGVPVTTYRSTITFAQLFAAEGGDRSALAAAFDEIPTGASSGEALLAAMDDLELDIEAGIDEDGLVRRVAFSYDESFIVGLLEALDQPVPPDLPALRFAFVLELYDVGDDSVTVDLPEVDQPVDLTSWATNGLVSND